MNGRTCAHSLDAMLPRATEAVDNVVTGIEEARRRRTADLILELDLTEPLVEGVPADPLSAALARRKTPLRVALDGLRKAARDHRVVALVVKAGGSRPVLQPGRAQELGDAIATSAASGKLAVAWAETFGEFNHGSVGYYVATFCDEIWLQPSGDVCLTGLAIEVPFLRGALDKAGIVPQLAQRHEYKNAANVFTERAFTDAHREATQRIVESMMDQLLTGIAANRNLAHGRCAGARRPGAVVRDRGARSGSGRSPRLSRRRLRRGARAGRDRRRPAVRRALCPTEAGGVANRLAGAQDTVALVHVTGPIHLGPSGRQPLRRVERRLRHGGRRPPRRRPRPPR